MNKQTQNISNDETFQVILKGTKLNISPSEAKAKLAVLFKATYEQIDNILKTPGYVVKRAIPFDVASKYKIAIEGAGGICELVMEEVIISTIEIDLPNAIPSNVEVKRIDEYDRLKYGIQENFRPLHAENPSQKISTDGAVTASNDCTKNSIFEVLEVLREKISSSSSYLGVLIGFGVFAFSFFLSWASIPTGLPAADGGSITGWNEKAYLAIIPLVFTLYPVFLHRSVNLTNLLISIVIAFALLGYNNVINRATWHSGYQNWGSALGAGFWIGLIAMVAISIFGVAWSLHTLSDDDDSKKSIQTDPNINTNPTTAASLVSKDQETKLYKEISEATPSVAEQAFWNPLALSNWSFFLTPIFGAYLVTENYKAMGKFKEAKGSMDWLYISIAIMLSAFLLIPIFGSKDGFLIVLLAYIANFLVWNFRSARKQKKYIVSIYGKNYERQPWGKVLILGIVANIMWQLIISQVW